MNITVPFQISRFGKQGIYVLDRCYKQSIIISPSVCRKWDVDSINQVTESVLIEAISHLVDDVDVLLFGYGQQQHTLPLYLVKWAKKAGVNLEVMTTISAVKSYNLLIVENRQPAGLFLWNENNFK